MVKMDVFLIVVQMNNSTNMWYLNENVYFVKGKQNAALYDLNKEKLYHINLDAKLLLTNILNNNLYLPNDEQLNFLNTLYANGLITYEYVTYHNITDLVEDRVIDFVWIEVTTYCNLKCVHCYDEVSSRTQRNMKYEDFKIIIDQLVEYGIKRIQLIGGEPFILGDRLIEFLDYTVGKFEYIEIFTNGTLIKEEYLSYLKEHNIRIALSVYSYEEEYHNKVTKCLDSWSRTNSIIKKLCEYAIPYRVKNVLMDGVELGIKNTDLYTLSKKKDIVRMVGRANIKLLNKDLLYRKLITENHFSRKISASLVKKLVSGHNCFASRLYFTVDLDVAPCVMERRIYHGNLKNTNIKELIDDNIRTLNKDEIKGCQDCEFRYCCFDCRPDSLDNDVFAKPWYCTYDPYLGKWCDPHQFVEDKL